MLKSTLDATAAIWRTDPTIEAKERARLLRVLQNPDKSTATPNLDRIMRRVEAAALLGCTKRTIDNLAASGALHKVRLPGRVRGCGFRASDVQSLVEGSTR